MRLKSMLILLAFFYGSTGFSQVTLMDINSWAYQLQNISISQISNNASFELIVIDYSADGTSESIFTSAQIDQIKSSGKKVISYISIGEAEKYRWYWDSNWDADEDGIPDAGAPEWLGHENPDWEGNYKVRFWYPQWQDIIFSYIDVIYSQGFDGIYCDIIDAYYYWSEEINEEPFADSLMIQFVLNIREHVSELTDDDFFIIPQNGEFIIEEANVSENLKTVYFEAIQGIGIEDIFFQGDLDENNPYSPDTERIEILQQYLANGNNVFSIEYLTEPDLIQQYLTAVEQYHFIPYATTRELDVLNDGLFDSSPTLVVNFNLPKTPKLFPIYPNPFNPTAKISYSIPSSNFVTLQVYDSLGKKINTLVSKFHEAGIYSLTFDTSELASGIYFYKLQVGNFVETKKCCVCY